jgi:ribosome-associated toxin RatA of RatAB toxin-antitoxin module
MSEHTEADIVIAASAADIMAVVADVASYPEWTGAVKSAEVISVHPQGSPAKVRFVLDAGPIKDSYTLLYVWNIPESVTWSLAEQGTYLTGMKGGYHLADEGPGVTKVNYRLAVDVKIPIIGLMKRKAEKILIDTALKELKKRVEEST